MKSTLCRVPGTVGVSSRAASEYHEAHSLVDMIEENLIAERIAIESYREMVRYFGDRDPTARAPGDSCTGGRHANDMHDLLVSREGGRVLEKQALRAE
jgi:bacterioferritin